VYRAPWEKKIEALWEEEFCPYEIRSLFLSFTRKLITVVQKKKERKREIL